MSPSSFPRRFGFTSKLLLLGTTLPLLAACGTDDIREVSAGSQEELEQLVPTLRPGDKVSFRELSVVVPAAGEGVHAEAVLTNGKTVEFQLETDVGGRVALVRHEEPIKSVQSADVSALGACDEGAYNLLGWRWSSTYRWYFKADATPSELTVADAESAIRQSTTNITQVHNNCGLTDTVSATQEYMGRTTTATNITTSGGCESRDGKSVTGFGDLPTGTLAVTCTWYSSGDALESDARVNKADYNWTVDAGSSSCSNKFGLEAVMTHERGHTFGLGHVSSNYLTMRPAFGPCDSSGATLGLGDVRGLRAKY